MDETITPPPVPKPAPFMRSNSHPILPVETAQDERPTTQLEALVSAQVEKSLLAIMHGAQPTSSHAQPVSPSQIPELPLNSVVKIFTTSVVTKFDQPWQRSKQSASTGSGFPIKINEKRYILTNCHVVADATSVRLQKQGQTGKYLATVECFGYTCDLALLLVSDESFWTDLQILELSDVAPRLDDSVTAVGYPMGGSNVCVTRGVVSRIDIMDYTFGLSEPLLVFQIDAAINPGNSGGPVFDRRNQVIGVAFAGIDKASNIGYIIPIEVIKMFMAVYIKTGTFGLLSCAGFSIQTLENPDQRECLELRGHKNGLLVTHVHPLSPAGTGKLLQEGDVVLQIEGNDVAEDGTYVHFTGSSQERIDCAYLFSGKPNGSIVKLLIQRAGEKLEIDLPVQPRTYRVPRIAELDAHPQYVIVGGLVFCQLSVPWLMTQGGFSSPNQSIRSLCSSHLQALKEKNEDEEIVVLSTVLVHNVNHGYQGFACERLKSVNGETIRNLRHLADVIKSTSSDTIQFDLSFHLKILLKTENVRASEAEILRQHNIPCACSFDVQSPQLVAAGEDHIQSTEA